MKYLYNLRLWLAGLLYPLSEGNLPAGCSHSGTDHERYLYYFWAHNRSERMVRKLFLECLKLSRSGRNGD